MNLESPYSTIFPLVSATSAVALLTGCVGGYPDYEIQRPVEENLSVPKGFTVELVEDVPFEESELLSWLENLYVPAGLRENLYIDFSKNDIKAERVFSISYGWETYIYTFYYNDENKYNHIIYDAETFQKVIEWIYHSFESCVDDFSGEDIFGQFNNTHIALGEEWSFIEKGISMSFVAPNGENYSFITGPKRFASIYDDVEHSPIDTDIMELVHTLFSAKNIVSFPLPQETLAGSLSFVARAARLGYSYSEYVELVEWAQVRGFYVPDSNNPEESVRITYIIFSKEIYDEAVGIFSQFPYSESVIEGHSVEYMIECSTKILEKSLFRREKDSRAIDNLSKWPTLAQEYINRFPNISLEELNRLGSDWVRNSVAI